MKRKLRAVRSAQIFRLERTTNEEVRGDTNWKDQEK